MDAPEHFRGERTYIFAAILSFVGYWAALCAVNPIPIADEGGHHLDVIRQLFEGDWSWPAHLPMPPAFHALACAVCHVAGAKLYWIRLLSVGMGIVAVFAVGSLVRNRRATCPSASLLHFAWLPILFPYSALVYTDMTSVACLMIGFWLQTRKRTLISATFLLLACAVRPSNLIWAAFLVGLELVNAGSESRPSESMAAKRRTNWSILKSMWAHLLVLLVGGVFLVVTLGPWREQVEADRLRFNVAQFYLLGIFIVLLWFPVWMAQWPMMVGRLLTLMRRRPLAGIGRVLTFGLLVAFLTWLYENPHPWNHQPEFLRNRPLMAMEESHLLLAGAVALVLAAFYALLQSDAVQSRGRVMAMLAIFAVAYLAPHSLAEPRYYLVPAIFFNLLANYSNREATSLMIWYGTLSAAVAAYVCLYGHHGGGIW